MCDNNISLLKEVGFFLKRRRKSQGLTGSEVAEKLNISQQQYISQQQFNRYERGVSKISLHHLIELSELLYHVAYKDNREL